MIEILIGLIVVGFLCMTYDFFWLRKDAKKVAELKADIQKTSRLLDNLKKS